MVHPSVYCIDRRALGVMLTCVPSGLSAPRAGLAVASWRQRQVLCMNLPNRVQHGATKAAESSTAGKTWARQMQRMAQAACGALAAFALAASSSSAASMGDSPLVRVCIKSQLASTLGMDGNSAAGLRTRPVPVLERVQQHNACMHGSLPHIIADVPMPALCVAR